MCTIYFANQVHPHYPFIFLGNRDEAYDRPSVGLHRWPGTEIYSGRDLKDGGMWTALSMDGRIGFLTNYRDLRRYDSRLESRGHLIRDFLANPMDARTYLPHLHAGADRYNLYNLVFGHISDLHYYSNETHQSRPVPPGIHGLSNRLLDTPWFKVEKGKETLSSLLATGHHPTAPDLFRILDDREKNRVNLPTGTGLSEEEEFQLSSTFIAGSRYGTQYQTVMLVDKNGMASVWEKRRLSEERWIEKQLSFRLR